MTPRTVMFTLDSELSAAKAIELSKNKSFTRIPVYDKEPEKISGYVTSRDLNIIPDELAEKITLKKMKRDLMFVPGVTNILKLLMTMLSKKAHLAMVIDEYGGMDGLVTLEDAIETILGTEIIDEKDKIADWQEFAIRKKRNFRA